MSINIMPIEEASCSIMFNNDILKIKGNIDFYQPNKIIGPFIEQLHNEIIRENKKDLKIDIKELMFLNSSGIKEFVSWVIKILGLKKEQQYKLIFLCSKKINWQVDSLGSLKLINKDLVEMVYE